MILMCHVGKCNRPTLLGYAAFGAKRTKDVDVCEYHWKKHCNEVDKFDLRLHFYPKENKRAK